MPPKPKKPAAIVIDGVNTADFTREQLEQFALKLKEELEREREERNYFQLERDKLRTFWEITRNDLEEARCQLRNKDRQIELADEKNAEELKVLRQKVKHLEYENEVHSSELRAECMLSLEQAQNNHTEQENELLNDKKELKKKLRVQEVTNYDQIQNLKLMHSEEIYKIRKHFEDMAKETEMKYEKMYEVTRQELHTKHTMEISEIEERKNKQISALVNDHNKAFTDIKNYYNDITLNNLALISSLKEQMEDLQLQNDRMAKQVADVTKENKNLVEPLKAAQEIARDLKRQLQNYEKDKIALANTTLKLKQTAQELDEIKWASNALELRFEQTHAEKNSLKKKFVQGIMEVQQKSGLKNLLLQQKINNLETTVESKEATLGELVAATKLQPHTINRKLEELLKRKNRAIRDLQYELARVCKAHDDLLQTYEAKLQTYGIPMQELGFNPVRYLSSTQSGPSKGPAGLVTKNR